MLLGWTQTRCQLSRSVTLRELAGMPLVRLPSIPRPAWRQRRSDHVTGNTLLFQEALQRISTNSCFVHATYFASLCLQFLVEPSQPLRVVHHLELFARVLLLIENKRDI